MKLRIILILAVVAISLSLSSCITFSETLVEITCDQINKSPHSRNEFQVEVGDKITVKLCSNPTTGFQWKYETIGEIVLEEKKHEFVAPEDEGAVGAAGQEVWTFEATEKGTTEIRMEYTRPWEGGEQEQWTYTFTATVD